MSDNIPTSVEHAEQMCAIERRARHNRIASEMIDTSLYGRIVVEDPEVLE